MSHPPAAGDSPGARLAAEAQRFAVPRLAGTEGDGRVRAMLAEALRDAGLVVRESSFGIHPRRSMARFRLGFLVIAATLALHALGLGGAATPGQYAARLLLLVAGAGGIVVALTWDEGFFAGGNDGIETANLLGFTGANGGRRVVVVAHHDSKSQTIGFGGRALLLAVVAGGVAALVLEAALRMLGATPPREVAWALTGAIAAGGLAAAVFGLNAVGNRSPGGVDNAGSLAVALELARRIARTPEPEAELVVVFTGAEELLMCGARQLVRERGEAWREGTALIVNLEALGVPGPLGVQGAREPAQRALAEVAAAGARGRLIGVLPAAMSDAWPLARAGFPVVTLTAGSLSRAIRAIHTPRDRAEQLDPTALERATDALERVVRDAMRA